MKLELLAPAGERDSLVAALKSGADAVYLGGQALNARRGAGNFDADGLKWAADSCHERGRKVYVTVNTLLKQGELAELEGLAAQLAAAGVDGAIVQDLGCASALRAMLPTLPLHASTQMAIHNAQGVRFLKARRFERVVLARELTFAQIAACAGEGVEVEVFGHGALCVCCSGQCLFSSLVGGRSGNRGLCAQPCRLPYQLRGAAVEARGALLSPRDLMQLYNLPALRAAGVSSLKLEGRLKKPEYVAVVTRVYREAIDRLEDGEAGAPGEEAVSRLLRAFNRDGFTRGYGPGVVDRELMCDPDSGGQPHSDAAFLQKVQAGLGAPEPPSARLRARLTLRVGQAAALELSDGLDEARAEGEIVPAARKRPADLARLAAQVQKTGGTPYEIESVEIDADADAFAPLSALNALRREALDRLAVARVERRRGCARHVAALPELPARAPAAAGPVRLLAQSADPALLLRALSWGADEIVYAPADLTRLRAPDAPFVLALPMTLPGGDLEAVNAWAWTRADRLRAVLIANPGQLALSWPCALRADFGLNAANNWTLDLLRRQGVESYVPSVELTAREIAALDGDLQRELIVYGRLPLMQLRHCPLNARLGEGPHAACRRCDCAAPDQRLEAHELVDRKGVAFPLRRLATSEGCIVRVLNSVPMMPLRRAGSLPAAARWRLIFEGGEDAEAILRLYRRAADGLSFEDMPEWAQMQGEQTTAGHYFRGVE